MPGEKGGRALRPRRGDVDYTATAEASSTPRWMKQSARDRADSENAPDSAANAEVAQPSRKRARKNARAAEPVKVVDEPAEAAPAEEAEQEQAPQPASPAKARSGSSGRAPAKKGARRGARKGERKQQEATPKGGQAGEQGPQPASEGHSTEQPRQPLAEARASAADPGSGGQSAAPAAAQAPEAGPSEQAADENAPPPASPPAAGPSCKTFKALMAEHLALLGRYQDVKGQRIVEVEAAIGQIRAQERERTQKALQLAAHWETEAQRQAAVAASGEAAQLRRQLEGAAAEAAEQRRQLLDARAEVLRRDETIIGLKRRLGELVVLAEAMEQLSPASSQERGPSPLPAAPPQPPAAEQPPGSAPAQAGSAHTREAASVCPEGASAGEASMPPPPPRPEGESRSDVRALLSASCAATEAAAAAAAPTGTVQCVSSAKPLVPYRPGLSAAHAPPKSRFAAEAAGTLRDGEAGASAQQPVTAPAPEASLPQTPAGTPAEAGQAAGIERQLSFTPQPAATPAAGAAGQTEGGGGDRDSHAGNGLHNLLGLALLEARPRGGFSYRHPPTDFVFEIVADDSDDSDEDGAPLLVFNPLQLGAAEPALPPFFKYEIKFEPRMKTRLVSMVMDYLDKAARGEAVDA